MLTFCAARLEAGFGLVARLLALEERVSAADLVLTGEGAADARSLVGKAPHGLAAIARRLGKPVILFAGAIPAGDRAALRGHFDGVHAMLDESRTVDECLRDAARVLRETVAAAARRR